MLGLAGGKGRNPRWFLTGESTGESSTVADVSTAPDSALRTLLVRHAHAAGDWVSPTEGPPLSPLGVRQAQRLALRLSSVPLTMIYTSPIPRAVQTAEYVAQAHEHCHIRKTGKLREIDPAMVRGGPMPPGQKRKADEMGRRAHQFLHELRAVHRNGETVLAICHGNIIRYLLHLVLGIPLRQTWPFVMSHTGVTTVDIAPDRTGRLVRLNDCSHLSAGWING